MTTDLTPPSHRQGILGVHVTGRKVYLAFRTTAGSLDDNPNLRRADPSDYMDTADALYDFCRRFQQRLRECNPAQVAFLHTRNYQPRSYSEAFKRASIESAVMIATRAEGINYTLVRQEDVAAHLSLPARWRAADLAEAAMKLHPDRPVYWADRSLAYAAAVTAAVEAV